MLLDAQHQFSDAQSLSATAVATNVIDLLADRSIGTGEPMCVLFQVDVAADQGTGDETYTFEVEYASNAAQSTGRQLVGRRVFQAGTPTAPNQDADLLVAGFIFYIPIPPTQLSESERFIGVRYTLAGTTPTLTVTAFLQPQNMIQESSQYADGLTITG
jgi:hypothetical protein